MALDHVWALMAQPVPGPEEMADAVTFLDMRTV
ncbi:hypothetical protein J2X76_002224 [Neorhizobium sp. 2083]|nr:hypothetical protein [Neorhizobium sp. 2083]